MRGRTEKLARLTLNAVLCALALASLGCSRGSTVSSQVSWDPQAAAAYLDRRMQWWSTWKNSARDHGTFCFSCHTAVPYALARPALSVRLAESAAAAPERQLMDDVRRRVRLWGETGPFYSDQYVGAGKSAESRGTEAVLSALMLAWDDARAGRLSADTLTAFEHMWSEQLTSGDSAGAWSWLDFDLSPWESAAADAQYYGAALAALAVGVAPENYQSRPEVQDRLRLLRGYLARARHAQSLHHRLILLWAAAKLPGLLDADQQQSLIAEALQAQNPDGGWSLATLMSRSPQRGAPGSHPDSDGYATGLTTLVLEEAATPAAAPRLQQGLTWLERHQLGHGGSWIRGQEGFWAARSLNKWRNPWSNVGRFMSDAATAYAVLALTEPSRAPPRVAAAHGELDDAGAMSRPERTLALSRPGFGLGARVAGVAGLLLLEKLFLNLFVDFESAQTAEGLGAAVRVAQHWVFRFLTSFAVATAVFAYLRAGAELRELDAAARAQPLRPRWLLAHLVLFAPLVPLSASLYGQATRLPFGTVVALWVLLAVLAAAALGAALAPWTLWQKAIRALGPVWWYALVAAAGAALAMGWSQGLWTGMARVTFEVVYRLLNWVVPTLEIDPANRIIDSGRFAVSIDPVCSGLEGMGLMLAFTTVLLLLFRDEYLFPRALLLIPGGLLLSFALNIARIAGLVLIGNAGYPEVAVYGFHSQAGWIAFNAAAVALAVVSLRSGWFSRDATERTTDVSAENPTAVYLLPCLAVILAAMLSRALSGGFEGAYWLRLMLGGAALGYSLPRLRGLDWRFSWRGGLAGVGIFAIWVAAAHLMLPAQGMPPALAGLSAVSRDLWVIGHILASVGVIPLAEELAFRGYLMRRLQTADFETLLPQRVGTTPLLASAVVFGLCQGAFWLPGVVAGAALGLIYRRSGRLGEAVAAHASANALVAVAVLAGSQWQLW